MHVGLPTQTSCTDLKVLVQAALSSHQYDKPPTYPANALAHGLHARHNSRHKQHGHARDAALVSFIEGLSSKGP